MVLKQATWLVCNSEFKDQFTLFMSFPFLRKSSSFRELFFNKTGVEQPGSEERDWCRAAECRADWCWLSTLVSECYSIFVRLEVAKSRHIIFINRVLNNIYWEAFKIGRHIREFIIRLLTMMIPKLTTKMKYQLSSLVFNQ